MPYTETKNKKQLILEAVGILRSFYDGTDSLDVIEINANHAKNCGIRER